MKHAAAELLLALLLVVIVPISQASIIVFTESLSGPQESPSNGSPGTGNATVTLDTGAQTLHVIVTFMGLSGTTTASHIHCCTASPGVGTAGVATTTPTFAGFPLGVTAGSYDHVLDLTSLSSYNPAFVGLGTAASAEAALIAGMLAGDTYLNIHTSVFGGGEIRGFLPAAAVSEPTTIALLGIGLAGFAVSRRRKLT